MSAALRRRLVAEDGIAMVLVVIITSFMTLLSVVLINQVRGESTRGARATWSQASFQAAEAGLDDYVAKLVDDHGYFLHYVHPAESTRSPSSGVNAPHSTDCSAPTYSAKSTFGVAWGYSRTWTYPLGKDHWCQLPNGYYYNLQIYPPGTAGNATTSVRIVATGRRSMTTTDDMRALESFVRPSNLADFYRFSDATVSIDAETFGKIYSNGNVVHTGTAHADIYAEGSVTGPPTMVDGAQIYQNGNFGTKIKNHPIDFSKFLVSLTDIKRAAQSGGVYLYEAGRTSWNIVFNANGTFTAAPCTGSTPEITAPSCGSSTTYNVPTNGAIFTDVSAIVSGQVQGRVTVGSGDDVIVRDNIAPLVGGDDVLGLVAYSDLWVAQYAPAQLTWTAAVLVETNTWHSAGSSHGSGSKMTFTGSSATATGGSFTQYSSRVYSYDQNLQYLSPPWSPAVDDTYTVTFFREVKP
jgi:hypothetical protein